MKRPSAVLDHLDAVAAPWSRKSSEEPRQAEGSRSFGNGSHGRAVIDHEGRTVGDLAAWRECGVRNGRKFRTPQRPCRLLPKFGSDMDYGDTPDARAVPTTSRLHQAICRPP